LRCGQHEGLPFEKAEQAFFLPALLLALLPKLLEERVLAPHVAMTQSPGAAARPTTCPQARRVEGGNCWRAFRRVRLVIEQARQEEKKN
jgi:hypothetical protein